MSEPSADVAPVRAVLSFPRAVSSATTPAVPFLEVSGRSNPSSDDDMRLNLSDGENWSIEFDIFILAKTLPALLSHKGAW